MSGDPVLVFPQDVDDAFVLDANFKSPPSRQTMAYISEALRALQGYELLFTRITMPDADLVLTVGQAFKSQGFELVGTITSSHNVTIPTTLGKQFRRVVLNETAYALTFIPSNGSGSATIQPGNGGWLAFDGATLIPITGMLGGNTNVNAAVFKNASFSVDNNAGYYEVDLTNASVIATLPAAGQRNGEEHMIAIVGVDQAGTNLASFASGDGSQNIVDSRNGGALESSISQNGLGNVLKVRWSSAKSIWY